jgi:hypothetical protein
VYVSPQAWAAVGKLEYKSLQAHAGSWCKVQFLLSVYGTTGPPGVVPCDMYVLQTWCGGKWACNGGFCTDTGRVATLDLVEHRHVQAESTPVHQSKPRAVSLRDTEDDIGTNNMLAIKVSVQGKKAAPPITCLRHELKTQIQDPSASDDT